MQALLLALLVGYATANEFDWMLEPGILEHPLNWTINSKSRYEIYWEKVCGDPHGMIGEGRFHNETFCFDFGANLPDNSKLKAWWHKKYNWEVRLVLTKKIPTASGLEVHHDFIDEVILFFNGKEKVRATRYHGVFWPDPASNPTSADNNLVSVTYADTFSFTDGDFTVELADNVVTFVAHPPKPKDRYEFIIYQNGSLVAELIDGRTVGKLSGVIGRLHEYRVFTSLSNDTKLNVGDRAVVQLNSVNEKAFEVEKIIHSHPHKLDNGFEIPHECWHPLPFVDKNKYAYDLTDYLV